jgi:hypothetical protein
MDEAPCIAVGLGAVSAVPLGAFELPGAVSPPPPSDPFGSPMHGASAAGGLLSGAEPFASTADPLATPAAQAFAGTSLSGGGLGALPATSASSPCSSFLAAASCAILASIRVCLPSARAICLETRAPMKGQSASSSWRRSTRRWRSRSQPSVISKRTVVVFASSRGGLGPASFGFFAADITDPLRFPRARKARTSARLGARPAPPAGRAPAEARERCGEAAARRRAWLSPFGARSCAGWQRPQAPDPRLQELLFLKPGVWSLGPRQPRWLRLCRVRLGRGGPSVNGAAPCFPSPLDSPTFS